MALEELPQEPEPRPIGPYWILIALVIGVLILATLAFLRPIAGDGPASTPVDTTASLTPEGMDTPEAGEQTVTVTAAPPAPEDIGYTDGIIFCGSVLVLILLVGTLREVIRRRGY